MIETELLFSSWVLCFNKKEKTPWIVFYLTLLTQERNLSSDKKEYILNSKKNSVERGFLTVLKEIGWTDKEATLARPEDTESFPICTTMYKTTVSC